jgi:proline iminopeptidase
MNRRQVLVGSMAAAGSAALSAPLQAASGPSFADTLNPPGIKMAGIRMLPVRGGRFKVWTKTVGEGSIKVLLLHGGPAACHDYMEAFESFLPSAGIQMIYYDQLGCGNSDLPDDAALWTLDGYVAELEEVRQGLSLDHFVLLGHSWGGVLGIEYALRHQQYLRGLVISNMTAGMTSYLKRMSSLKAALLNSDDRALLDRLQAAKNYDSPAYAKLMIEKLYPQMVCRLEPWPEPLTRSFSKLNQKIYSQMQGKSEFEMTGNLKYWERWDRLHEIKVRSLMIGAKYDEMDPADLTRMAALMPNAYNITCPRGSHMSMWDDQSFYFKNLLKWLKMT